MGDSEGDRNVSAAPRVGVRRRLRYRFDNLLARGTWAALLWLGLVTLGAVLVSALLLTLSGVTLSGSESGSWLEDFWQSLLRTLDSGTMAGDVGWGRRLLALTVTVFGLLVAGTLIGIIATGVEDRIDQMRRGRSAVIESGHIVVLGESEGLPVVINQLVLANAHRPGNTIVVLADRDPAELSDVVDDVVGHHRGTRLVYRSGDPTRLPDLGLVSLDAARTVVIVNDSARGGDARAVHAALAVGSVLGGFDRMPILVALDHVETAQSLLEATGGGVIPLVEPLAVGRLAAFAVREPGLSAVITELTDFNGADLHVIARDDVVGQSFGTIATRFAKARPIGRVRAGGEIDLNPSVDVVFEPGDQVVLIADDADDLDVAARLPADLTDLEVERLEFRGSGHTDRLLVFGWNHLGAHLLAGWSHFAGAGSTAHVLVDPNLVDLDAVDLPDLGRVGVTLAARRPGTDLVDLENPPTTVVVLGYTESLSSTVADGRTLMDLTHLRRELAVLGDAAPRVIVELLDPDNVDLARMPGADDFLVSAAVSSQFLAQLADQPARRPVLLELYGDAGVSFHLVPFGLLGLDGAVTTSDIVVAGLRHGVVAVGWRTADGTLELNPHESATVDVAPHDRVVVIG